MLTLFSGPDCHLCDLAEQLIKSTLVTANEDLEKTDVSKDHNLYHLYGARIPVLKRNDIHDELCWPFDQQQLIEFLS